MSCGCGHNPCTETACDPANEPLASALNNFITAFFGSLTKTCVNNQVVWVLPCDLDDGIPGFPRVAGEGLACYFLRFMAANNTTQGTGSKGYNTRALTNSDVSLVAHTDDQDQDFTGTLTGPVSISLSSTGALEGDHFYISFTGLVITAVNNVTIKSDATTLLLINTAGTLTGYFKAVYTGTEWKLTLTSQNIV